MPRLLCYITPLHLRHGYQALLHFAVFGNNVVVKMISHLLPYSGKFSLVQNFTEMHPDSSEEIFTVFIFMEQRHDTLTTPLPVDSHTPHVNSNNLVFLLCGGLRSENQDCRRGRETGLLDRRIQHC